jgi:hypothetical protein
MEHPVSVDNLRTNLKDRAEWFAEEIEPDAELPDEVFREIDAFFQSQFSTGPINNMSPYPTSDYGRDKLMSVLNLLQLADMDAWVTEDSGLWEGMDGQQVLYAQAFHSAENLLREYLPEDVTQ